MLDIDSEENAVVLRVKVVPGASRTRYMGELDEQAKIAVAAAPERGKANKELIAYLAEVLGAPKRDITVVSGHTTPQKKVRIANVAEDAVRAALGRLRS
jgi:uncharacterized protein (TIGR00251 family)